MRDQAQKGSAFRALHETGPRIRAGYAFSLGQRDNTIDRDTMMTHVNAIVSATDLPVSADLENGFSHAEILFYFDQVEE